MEGKNERHGELIASLNAISQELKTSRQQEDAAEPKKARREWLTIWGLLGTALIAALALYVSIDQSAMARRALSEAQAANQTARDANQTARDVEHRQLRAYVYLEPVDIKVAVGGRPTGGVIVHNPGQTPAFIRGVVIHQETLPMPASGQMLKRPSDVPEDPDDPNPSASHRRDFVYQNKTITLTNPNVVPLTAGEFRQFRSGADGIFVFGRVWYEDIFDKHHWTSFCYVIVNSEGGVRHCHTGVEVDRND